MLRARRKVAGVAVAGLALLSPTVARAQVGIISDGMAFTGFATTTPPVQYVGGSAFFIYDSVAGVCFSNLDEPSEIGVESPVGNVGLCHVHASGFYFNIVCGTGSAFFVGFVAGESAAWSILFVATVGILAGTLRDTPGDPSDIDPEQLLGVAQFGPPGVPPPPPACTTGFTATGVAVALECTPILTPTAPGTVPPWSLGGLPPTCSATS